MTLVGGIALSPEQQEVVAWRGGHLQVVACAGSGKTEAISRRIASLIADGADPGSVVAFTFTERAAAALRTRIMGRVADLQGPEFLDKLGPTFIGTIHAYCLRLLQSYAPQYGNFDVLDEHRLAGLLSREHRRLGLDGLGDSRHWRPIFDFLRNADVVDNELIDPARLKGTPFGECYARYLAMLERYHVLTFGQLVSKAVRALDDSRVYARVHDGMRYLFVDEYQDVNKCQEALIERLGQAPVELCVVGDDDQAIYQWRGSDVANILEFRRRYGAETRELSVNRRSRPAILEAANAFACSIAQRQSKAMTAWRPAAQPELHAWSAEKPEDEAAVIAETIGRLTKIGYRPRDMAVLFRSVRTSADPLIAALRAADIPIRCAGRTGLFKQDEAAVLGATYAWLCGFEWKEERYGEAQKWDLTMLVDQYASLFTVDPRELAAYLNGWHARVAGDDVAVSLVKDYYRLLNLLGVRDLDLTTSIGQARMGCLARFSEILADFEHVTRRARYVDEEAGPVFRGGQDRGTYFYRRLFNYLQHYALDAYEDFEGEETFDLDAVSVLTVHQAKGLEWPVVFLPSLVEGRFPSRRAGKPQDWLLPTSVFGAKARARYDGGEMEERRLFYVALTRAKDCVYLSRFRRMKRACRPSPFLTEVAGGDPKPDGDLPLPPPFEPSLDEADELPTLSFSDLAHYDDCPFRYRLSTSFGFQPQLATELGYGKAIHHVLRRLADVARQQRSLPTSGDVDRVFAEEFYLPFANRAAFAQLKEKAERLVARYLGEYSGDLLRVWETERPFSLHVDAGVVTGRADVILDEEGGRRGALALVDYKTAADPAQDDVFAFQLAIYAAAGRGEGFDVEGAYLQDLSKATRVPVDVGVGKTEQARTRATSLITSITDGEFPSRPDGQKCPHCDMRAICRDAACSKDDL
ncbi:MAG TPA: ATP-dependent DNA helicase [Vicinamibacterales bacterium]|nr:ATP-dependent DNA helicase [Vicinamibacterales bacterium]